MARRHDGSAWLRLNAYGVMLAALCVLNLLNLAHPGSTQFAILVGDVPPGQSVWVTGFVVAGILLLVGFVRGDRIAETIGLVLMELGIIAQTIVAYALLGVTEFSNTQVVLVCLVTLLLLARSSVLWSKDGLSIRIPPRGEHQEETEGEQ